MVRVHISVVVCLGWSVLVVSDVFHSPSTPHVGDSSLTDRIGQMHWPAVGLRDPPLANHHAWLLFGLWTLNSGPCSCVALLAVLSHFPDLKGKMI